MSDRAMSGRPPAMVFLNKYKYKYNYKYKYKYNA